MRLYNKLIRDRIPEILKEKGIEFSTRTLDDSEFKSALLSKLVEEANEVKATEGKVDDLITELADVAEVISAIIHEFGIDPKLAQDVCNSRRQDRGGFKDKILLKWTCEG